MTIEPQRRRGHGGREKRERSPFEVKICRRSLLKFKLQLLCGINLV
ncbi:MAG: hypothetical protein V7L14_21615 [Nostoc sp.]